MRQFFSDAVCLEAFENFVFMDQSNMIDFPSADGILHTETDDIVGKTMRGELPNFSEDE